MKNSIFAIAVLTVTVSCKQSAKKEMHLLPGSFVGKAIIFFDDSTGIFPDSNDYRVYDFSDSGVLRTRVRPNDGFLLDNEQLFFYKMNKGKIPIPLMIEFNESLVAKYPNKVYVFNLKSGRYNKSPYFSYCVDSLKNAIFYYEEGAKEKTGRP